METATGIRRKLVQEIKNFISNSKLSEFEKGLFKSSLYYSDDEETWGSLARGTLVLLLTDCHPNAVKKAIGVELLHHASLIVDDIIDNAIERRGRKAFWRKHGVNISILFAHKLVSIAGILLSKDPLFFETINSMVSCEIESQYKKTSITNIKEYEYFVLKKTGKLYGLIINIVKENIANNSVDYNFLKKSFENIGVSHQILDDKSDYNNKDVFLTNDAFIEERNVNFFNLENFGYSLSFLEKFYAQLGEKALDILRKNLSVKSFPNKKSIIELCHCVAFGKRITEELSNRKLTIVQ